MRRITKLAVAAGAAVGLSAIALPAVAGADPAPMERRIRGRCVPPEIRARTCSTL